MSVYNNSMYVSLSVLAVCVCVCFTVTLHEGGTPLHVHMYIISVMCFHSINTDILSCEHYRKMHRPPCSVQPAVCKMSNCDVVYLSPAEP